MLTHQSGGQSHKDVMSKTSFLTYRQPLTLTAPGSSRPYPLLGSLRPRFVDSVVSALRGIALSVDLSLREYVLCNLIVAAYFTYSAASRVASFVSLRKEISLIASCRWIKRTIDIFGAGVGLIILSPLFALVGLAVKLDSDGPVFFVQTRVGRNRRTVSRRVNAFVMSGERRSRDRRKKDLFGKPFAVYKFRSMVNNAEKKSGPIWATHNDPRITRVGAFLRKTRIDELPQLLNVLRGEMSLVGPRPERPVFVEKLSQDISDYPKRLNVKPGITGLAQVTNGYDTSVSSVKEKVRHDLHYINNWSLLQDIRILLKTIVVVVTGKGAF